METFISLDNTNIQLLTEINELGEASIAELSNAVYLTQDAVRRRLNKLEQEHLITYRKKRKSNGAVAHFFTLNNDFEEELVFRMQDDRSISASYLEKLSENQLKALTALALIGQGTVKDIFEKSGMKKSSSTHSALSRLIGDKTVRRRYESEGKSGYIYFFTNLIPARDCIEEFNRRFLFHEIQECSLLKMTNNLHYGSNNDKDHNTNDLIYSDEVNTVEKTSVASEVMSFSSRLRRYCEMKNQLNVLKQELIDEGGEDIKYLIENNYTF
ncbi:AsnC family transcriptional regulator [Myxosarcina sp. GI1]|uniref:AsnC family transcriptional regulator n=1 Tax=Myxosarcina sp. GI1 TaxID=1541065 RepID=UPI000560FF65|nr:AsnC family transcriptional regulator [Myxosarcina sp. GI1]